MSSFAITWAPILFGFALFLSSGLLFVVQPMIGKSVLPQLGGSSLAWTVCLVFFQATLLASYIYADLLHRFRGLRWQPWVQTLLLGCAIFLCFVGVFGDEMLNHLLPRLTSIEDWPIVSAFAVLIVTIGLPYFALAAVGPLVQRWFAHLDHPRASDPYFLFVASNLGGLSALVIYISMIDGNAPLAAQWMSWKLAVTALGILVLLTAFCVWRSPRNPELEPPDPNDPNAPLIPKLIGRGEATWGRRLFWLVAAALPTGMLLSLTDLLTLDLAPVPTLWSLPLAVYLLAFGQSFGRWAPYEKTTPGRRIAAQVCYAAVLAFVGGLVLFALIDNRAEGERMEFGYGVLFLMMFFIPSSWLGVLQPLSTLLSVFVHANVFNPTSLGSGVIVLHMMSFYLSARLCLGTLAKDRPAAPALTTYYIWIAVGGLVGGLFQLLIAPLAFQVAYLEYFFLAALASTLRPAWLPCGVTEWIACSLFARKRDVNAPTEWQRKTTLALDLGFALVATGAALGLFLVRPKGGPALEVGEWFWRTLRGLATDSPLVIALTAVTLMLARPLRFGFALAGVVVFSMIGLDNPHWGRLIARQRTSFGILSVTETTTSLGVRNAEDLRIERSLTQSNSQRGVCMIEPQNMRRHATFHHHRRGPAGQVMHRLSWFMPTRPDEHPARLLVIDRDYWLDNGRDNVIGDARLAASLFGLAAAPMPMANNLDIAALWTEPPYAIAGLGVGSLYTYAHPGQWVDAYELDPAIIAFSTDSPPMFHYFQSAQARGVQGKIFAGDARRALSKPGREGFYHVIFVDAFNSCAIPTHLLTVEAVQTYLQKLAPGGLICINVTNRYVELRHVLERVARDRDLQIASRVARGPAEDGGLPTYAQSTWVMLARSEEIMQRWEKNVGPFAAPGLDQRQRFGRRDELWTDDSTNLIAAVREGAGWPSLIHWMLGLSLLVGALLALVEVIIVTQNRTTNS